MNRKMSPHEARMLWMGRVVIWVTIIIVLFPVLWIVMSSFSAGDSFFLSSLFPKKFSIEHYTSLFQETNFMLWTWNSVKLCLIVAAIQLAMTSLAAYAFSRLRFTGRKYGLMSLLVLQVFPSSMAVAGYYILIYEFGLVDSNAALIFVLAGGSAYNIWLLKSYMDGLPKELDEAAMVDGATHFSGVPENHSAVGSAAAGGYFPVLLYRNLQRVCDNIDLFADSGQDDPRTGTPDVYQ